MSLNILMAAVLKGQMCSGRGLKTAEHFKDSVYKGVVKKLSSCMYALSAPSVSWLLVGSHSAVGMFTRMLLSMWMWGGAGRSFISWHQARQRKNMQNSFVFWRNEHQMSLKTKLF